MRAASKPLLLIPVLLGTVGLAHAGEDPSRPGVPASPQVPPALVSGSSADAIARNHSRGQATPRSFLFFLYDVSKSFHSPDTTSLFLRHLPLLDETLWSWWVNGSPGIPRPIQVWVGTIGTGSTDQTPVCNFRVPEKSIFSPRAADSVALANDLQACRARLSGIPPEDYTDLASGLGAAIFTMRGVPSPSLRGIVIISDLADDPPPDRNLAPPDLSEVCVGIALASDSDLRVSADSQELKRRALSWRANFAKWGALDSEYWRATETQPNLGRFFRDCGLGTIPGTPRIKLKQKADSLIAEQQLAEDARQRQLDEEARQRGLDEQARLVAEETARLDRLVAAEAARQARQGRLDEQAQRAEEEVAQLIDSAEAAFAEGQTEEASTTLVTAAAALSLAEDNRITDRTRELRRRVDSIEVRLFRREIIDMAGRARIASSTGDYDIAIALLMPLDGIARGAPASRQSTMLALLDFYLIPEEIQELVREWEARGSTEPCGPR